MARSRLIRPRRKGLPILPIISVLMIASAFGLFIYELYTKQ